jgi:hypothetical protein
LGRHLDPLHLRHRSVSSGSPQLPRGWLNFSSACKMVKLAAFWRGGYCRNVARNCPTLTCVGTALRADVQQAIEQQVPPSAALLT